MPSLKTVWYRKLERAGFRDIETGSEHDGLLRTDKRIDPEKLSEYEAQAEYYRLAGQYLHEATFEAPFDRDVWERHAEGMSVRNIVDLLGSSIHVVHESIAASRKRLWDWARQQPGGEGGEGEPVSENAGAQAMSENRTPREILRDVLALLDADVQAVKARLEQRDPDRRSLTHDEVRAMSEMARLLLALDREKPRGVDEDLKNLGPKELAALREVAKTMRERRR